MYAIATVHLDFFQALQASRPDTWAQIRVPHVQCVRVCVRTHTAHIHQPPVKNGETLPPPKRIPHTGLAPTVDQLEKPRSPLFYIRMQWCLQHL